MAKLPSGWIFIPKMKNRTTIEVEQKELVMCRDCKNWWADTEEHTMYCAQEILPTEICAMGDGYCSMGEKEEGEE